MTRHALPDSFLKKCTATERSEVELWWQSLSGETRSDLYVLMDRRNDSRAFIYADDGTGDRDWRVLPIIDEGLLPEDAGPDQPDVQLEYFHHLLNHDDFVITPEMVVRSFRICVAHPEARCVVTTGALDCRFKCPIGDVACPIRKISSQIATATLLKVDDNIHLTTWLCWL